eukprot:scaffold4147_cov412-Prasinococcus_capsulatus_cf.AAC.12
MALDARNEWWDDAQVANRGDTLEEERLHGVRVQRVTHAVGNHVAGYLAQHGPHAANSLVEPSCLRHNRLVREP